MKTFDGKHEHVQVVRLPVNIECEGKKEGRREGRKEGEKERRKEGSKEGRKEGTGVGRGGKERADNQYLGRQAGHRPALACCSR